MKAPDKIYIQIDKPTGAMFVNYDRNDPDNIEYIRKDALLEWVKLAYGKVCMNPFDCSVAFEELIDQLEDAENDKVLPGFENDPIPIPGKDYIPDEWLDACEKYGFWKIVRVRYDINEPRPIYGPEKV